MASLISANVQPYVRPNTGYVDIGTTQLYALIYQATEASMKAAWRLIGQAILLPYIPMMQKQHRLSELEISIINGAMPFLAFFAVYATSSLADKLARHRVILIFMCGLCALAHLMFNVVPEKPVQWQTSTAEVICQDSMLKLSHYDMDRIFTDFNNTGTDLLECGMKCRVEDVSFSGNDVKMEGKEIDLQTHLLRPSVIVNNTFRQEMTRITDVLHEGVMYNNPLCTSEGNLTCSMECNVPILDSGHDFGLTFGIFFLVYFIAHMFYSPCTCLCDTLAYTALSARDYQYGMQRCFGTIGFIIASVLGGFLQNYTTRPDGQMDYDYNVYMFGGLMLLAAMAAVFIKVPEVTERQAAGVNANEEEMYELAHEGQNNHHHVGQSDGSVRGLLKDVRVWALILAMLLFGLNFGLVFAFLFWYMNELQLQSGYETQSFVMGLALAVAGVMELLFMIISGTIVKKLGEINCLILAFLAYALRFLLYSLLGQLGSIWWILAIETLYGPSFGLMFAAATIYANRISPPGMRATLQGLASGFHFNIGWGIGALLGGVIYQAIGGSYMFLSFSGLSLLAAVGLATINIMVLKKRELREVRLTGRVPASDLKSVSEKDGCTYVHALVLSAHKLQQSAGSVTAAIPVLYRLVLRGCDVNAQNHIGNTALHLSCFRPAAETFSQHLIRLGADPSIVNESECKVIHSPSERHCFIVKSQPLAKSGIWDAIRAEDMKLTQQYLRSWSRVSTYRKRRTLYSVADETGNNDMLRLLSRYKNTNELVVACLACDGPKVKELLSLKSDKCDINTRDESYEIPKPLLAEVEELLPYSADVVKLLQKHGAPDGQIYINEIRKSECEFESSTFYQRLTEGNLESLTEALQLLSSKQVNVHARSTQNDTRGFTWLHYIIKLYLASDDTFVRRYLVRILYRLALDGIDVNARDADGLTVLHRAFNEADRRIIEHVIRIGVDSSITTPEGKTVTLEKYDHKGRFVFTVPVNRNDLPGIWPAVEDRNVPRVTRWLKSGCRVESVRSGRSIRDVTKSLGFQDVMAVLEEYRQVNEFICSVISCDTHRMKHFLALGKGKAKVNVQDQYYHAGFTDTRCSEYVPRPLIISAMEYCTDGVVDMMYQFGVDFTVQYEECAPCGPSAFWCFRDDIDCKVTAEVAKYAELDLRDERGHTMLHAAILKNDPDRLRVVQILLERGIHVGARDVHGLTARDYCTMGVAKEVSEDAHDLDKIRQTIDDYVLMCVSTGEIEVIDRLILDSYDHILDISGTAKRKTAKELAYLKEQKDIGELLEEIEEYEVLIGKLHEACEMGDIKTLTKLFQEKRAAWGRDKGGRNLLHKSVLFGQDEVVKCLIEQYPDLINGRDNLMRTPVHYACCLGDGKRVLQLINQAGMTNLLTIEANKLSCFDYVHEMDQKETPTRAKTRGRRFYDFKVREMTERERSKKYGEAPALDEEEGNTASGTNLVINTNSEIMAKRPETQQDEAEQEAEAST